MEAAPQRVPRPHDRAGCVVWSAALFLTAVASAGVVRAQPPCQDFYRWAGTNSWKNPPTEIVGFNRTEDIAGGASVDVWRRGMVGQEIWGYDVGLHERGVRIHIENDLADQDDARIFDVRALFQYGYPGGNLQAQVRLAPPEGQTGGDDINADMPVVAGPVALSSPFTQYFQWCGATIDVGLGNELPTGDYYFCVINLSAQPLYAQCSLACDTALPTSGLVSPYLGQTDWSTARDGTGGGDWDGVDPLIVVRRCDPTPINHGPTARIRVSPGTSIFEGDTVQFDGSGSDDPDGDPLTCSWDANGDGQWDCVDADCDEGCSYTYDQAGSYTVTLRVDDGQLSDDDTVTIEVSEVVVPPSIGPIHIERRTGPDWPQPVSAVHTGDDQTRLRLWADVTGGDGEECDCEYEWSDDGDPFSDDPAPEGTIGNLGLTTVGRHTITLTVTDRETQATNTRSADLWIIDRPLIGIAVRRPVWGPEDFHYHLDADVVLQTGRLGLQGRGSLRLVTLDGATPLSDPANLVNPVPPWGRFAPKLRRENTFVWDPGAVGCALPITLLDRDTTESFRVLASGLVDENGYAFPNFVSEGRIENYPVVVPTEKQTAYNVAFAAWLDAWFWTGFAAGSFWCPPCAAIAAATATLCFATHEIGCGIAHDPLVPDPLYDARVSLDVPPLAEGSPCAADDGTDDGLRAGEASAILTGGAQAYGAALNKLAGVYEFVDPDQQPDVFTTWAAAQGSDLVRFAQVAADALGDLRDAQLAASQSLDADAEQIAAGQAQLSQTGLPQWFAERLIFSGIDPGQFLSGFLAADPYQIAGEWETDHSAQYDQAAELFLNQSYFAAPEGLVLVGITRPVPGAAVRDTITIDARVIHKKEYYGHCLCGDTVVTQVSVDGWVIAQVPPPPPHPCPNAGPPAPSAVPVQYDTSQLAEGPHTISVIAQDGCQPNPPFNFNTDTITIFVDRTPPVITVTSPDADPDTPGIQVYAGQSITYVASDDGSGLVGPAQRTIFAGPAGGTQSMCVADRAGNTATAQVDVVRPYLDNGIIRARFTDYGTSGDRLPHASAVPGDIAWLPISDSSQVYSWEGNLRYDDGGGVANHLLADPAEFSVSETLHLVGAAVVSRIYNAEFDIVATHWLDGATLATQLVVTNVSGRDLADVHLAWMLDADLNIPAPDPDCPQFPWLGFGSGQWSGPDGSGRQTNVNCDAGIYPPSIVATHTARLDGQVPPDQWTVSNPSRFQGSTCRFDGVERAESRYLFTLPFDNTVGTVGYDQDLAIVTGFHVANWPDGAARTFVYTLAFSTPPNPDLDADLDVDLSDLAALLANYGTTEGATHEDGDLDGDEDVDLTDLAGLLSQYGDSCP